MIILSLCLTILHLVSSPGVLSCELFKSEGYYYILILISLIETLMPELFTLNQNIVGHPVANNTKLGQSQFSRDS